MSEFFFWLAVFVAVASLAEVAHQLRRIADVVIARDAELDGALAHVKLALAIRSAEMIAKLHEIKERMK